MCQEIIKDKRCGRKTEPYCYQHGKTISSDSKKNVADSNINTSEPTDMSPLSQAATEPLSNMEEMQNKHEVKVVEAEINEPIYLVDETSNQITQKKCDSDGTESINIITPPSVTDTSTSSYINMSDSQDKNTIDFKFKDGSKMDVDIQLNELPIKVNTRIYKLLSLFKSIWFRDTDNLFKLVGYFYNLPFVIPAIQASTFIAIIMTKMDQNIPFDIRSVAYYWNQWAGKSYVSKFGERDMKQIAGGINPEKYTIWKAKYDPDFPKEAMKQIQVKQLNTIDSIISNQFEIIFGSERIIADIQILLAGMNRTFDQFKEAICDDSFRSDELSYWAEKYCMVRNQATNQFTLNYNHFEKIIKQLIFREGVATRFICYFIHEFFVFGIRSSDCYIRSKVCELNTLPLQPFALNEFKNVMVRSMVEFPLGSNKWTTINLSMFDVLKVLPYHKFTNQCHLWDHDSTNLDTFSMATPFQYISLTEFIVESQLVPNLVYYLKTIICNNCNQSWEWIRSYLANIIYQPDSRTETMLVLYSRDKRLGKSTMYFILNMILGQANIAKVESIIDAFGERGGPSLIGKRIVWLEELTDKKSTFRQCMDRMKTAITEKRTTYRKLFHETNEINNTNEYIACTNHLVGVLEDRMTILQVNAERKDDREFYAKLRHDMNQAEINKFVAYLKPYTTSLPMVPHKTTIYHSMLSNGSESVELFVNELKAGETKLIIQKKSKFCYCTKEHLYEYVYRSWCESNNEQILSFNRFKEKVHHYEHNCEYKRMRLNESTREYVFAFPANYKFVHPCDK